MSNQMFTDLPVATNANMSDIICAVQGFVSPSSLGVSKQATLQQIFSLFNSSTILLGSGNPNGAIAGSASQLYFDNVNFNLWVCITSGTSITAVWIKSINLIAGTGISIAQSGATITLNSTGVLSVTGTANQVNVSASIGNVTFSLPQSIATNSSPTFAGLTLTAALTVPNGGTGLQSTTAYAVLCGGTTSAGALQSIANIGTSGQFLTSNGPGALPSFQTVTATAAATQADQESATSTTTYVSPGRQQYHPSAQKVWLYSIYSAGVPQLSASYNVTSITDSGVGLAIVNFTVSFSSANFSVLVGCNVDNTSTVTFQPSSYSLLAGSVRVSLVNNAGSSFDPFAFYVSCSGDQP